MVCAFNSSAVFESKQCPQYGLVSTAAGVMLRCICCWLGSVDVTRPSPQWPGTGCPGHHWQPPSPGHQPWTNHIPPVTSPPSPASAAQQIFSTHRRNIFCFTRRAAEHHNTDITLPPRVSRCRGNLCLTTLLGSGAPCRLSTAIFADTLRFNSGSSQYPAPPVLLTAVAVLLSELGIGIATLK